MATVINKPPPKYSDKATPGNNGIINQLIKAKKKN